MNEPICDSCGKPATIFDIDPYIKDLFGEENDNEEQWWCDECYREAMNAI